MSSDERPRKRRVLRRLLRGVAYLVLLLLAAELGVRIWNDAVAPEGAGVSGAVPLEGVERVGYQLNPFFQLVNPPRPGVDPGPDYAGWRIDPPDAGRATGRTRILFLGGAATDYPRAVRAALEPTLGPVTVYDLSADWHSSLHSLYKFWTYVDEIEPDLVVVQHNIEDFYRGFTPARYSLPEYRADYSHYAGPLNLFWTPTEARGDRRPVFHSPLAPRVVALGGEGDPGVGGLFRSIYAGSQLVRAVRGLAGERRIVRMESELGLREAPPPDRYTIMFADQVLRSLPAFERNMRNLQHGCRTKQVRALFLTMPFLPSASHKTYLLPGRMLTNDGVEHMLPSDFEFGMQAFNKAVLGLDAPKYSYVLDLAPALEAERWFEDEVRLTEAGQERQGELVAAFILERGLLPLPE